MNQASRGRATPRPFSWLIGLSVVALILSAFPDTSQAQTLVVANFRGRPKKVANRVRAAVVKALSDQGASLVSYKQYIRRARKFRIRPVRALKPRAIRRVAGKMNLDGVVTGAVRRKGRRFIITIRVFGSNGKIVAKKAYRLKRPRFPPANAEKLAGLVVERLGGTAVASAETETDTVEAPPPEPPAPEEETPVASAETGTAGSEGSGDAFLPPWARADGKTGDETTTASADTTPGTAEPATSTEVEKPAPRRKRRKSKIGSVPDILVTAAGSMNMRMGLNPRHESGIFPGIRADLRFFMGSFLDTVVVKDIGIGGMFNMGVGLKYGPENSEDQWDSSFMQWQGELTYRLGLNDIPLAPAFMLRFGYGSTTSTIDTTNSLAVSAGYSYPYAALDIYLMLYKPVLRLYVSGGYLFLVMTAEDLEGDGSGFTVRAGIDVDLFENLHIGVGYDLWQFLGFKVGSSPDETSDTFHSFFLRAGWNFQ